MPIATSEYLTPARAMKFILDFDLVEGDYSELRKKLFGNRKVNDIVQKMKEDNLHNL